MKYQLFLWVMALSLSTTTLSIAQKAQKATKEPAPITEITKSVHPSSQPKTPPKNGKSTEPRIISHTDIFDPKADSVYRWRVAQKELDGIYIPMDLNDCFKQLDKLMDNEVREKFLSFSDEEVDARTHGSLGVWLDAKWSLRLGSRISAYFNKMGVPHPDYMVGLVIRSYHRHLNKRDLDLKKQLSEFKEMWKIRRAKEIAARQKDKPKSTE